MSLSLYAQYISERRNRGIVETEFGFATFEFPTSEIVYLVDVYVVPEKREQQYAKKLVKEVCRVALELGRSQMVTSVDLSTEGAEKSVKILEKQGATILKVLEPTVYYIMDIKDIVFDTILEEAV